MLLSSNWVERASSAVRREFVMRDFYKWQNGKIGRVIITILPL